MTTHPRIDRRRHPRATVAPWRDCGKYASAADSAADALCQQAPPPRAWLDPGDVEHDRIVGPAAYSYCNEGKAA
jgi:hypothetical protein